MRTVLLQVLFSIFLGYGGGCFFALYGANFQPVIGSMAALGAGKVYARSGPGKEYPVVYTYYYPGLPVKILDVFALWCQVQDHRYGRGWIHKSLLRRPRYGVIVTQTFVYDRGTPNKRVGTIEKDVLVQCRKHEKPWCYIQPHKSPHGGWILCQYLWGGAKT